MGCVTEDEQRLLISACNLLCEFVGDKLPSGWEIRLSMCRNEATASLIDPSGDEIETDSPDSGIGILDSMCDTAVEIEGQRDAEGEER